MTIGLGHFLDFGWLFNFLHSTGYCNLFTLTFSPLSRILINYSTFFTRDVFIFLRNSNSTPSCLSYSSSKQNRAMNKKSVAALENLRSLPPAGDDFESAKRSAVLVPLVLNPSTGNLEVILTVRSSNLRTNAGGIHIVAFCFC